MNKRAASKTSPVVRSIMLRLLDLALMLYEDGVLSSEEISKKLDLPQEDQSALIDELAAAKANLEETEREIEEVKEDLEGTRSEINDYSLMFGRIVRLIAEALEEDPDKDWAVDEEEEEENLEEEEERSFTTVKIGLKRLIEDHDALRAEVDEEA